MKMPVYSDKSLQDALGSIRGAFRKHGRISVTISTANKRSLDQNAISHAWYEQISRELAEDTPEGVKAECKLRFGVPILRAEDEDFRTMYDKAIGAGKHSHLTYEQKLAVLQYLPVTSLMTTAQLSRYLEDMQRDYARRGVMLEFPMEAAA